VGREALVQPLVESARANYLGRGFTTDEGNRARPGTYGDGEGERPTAAAAAAAVGWRRRRREHHQSRSLSAPFLSPFLPRRRRRRRLASTIVLAALKAAVAGRRRHCHRRWHRSGPARVMGNLPGNPVYHKDL